MASICPNCGRKLKWYEIKAECKSCGVSIPNFNWEARLEEDNEKAEAKFQSFYRTLNMFAYSIWGTKLRIVRIILSFLPAIGFLLPWAYMQSDAESVGLDMLGIFTNGKSLTDVLGSFFGNTDLYFINMAYEGHSGALTYSVLSVMFMLLSALFIVIAFFMILFTNKNPKSKLMIVFDCLSILSAVLCAVMFTAAVKSASAQKGFNFGNIPILNASGSVSWGFFAALGLLIAALAANIFVAKAPAKSHEELEAERLKRKAAKEEKEHQDEIKKEKARAEAKRAADEEQKQLVEKARARLEADKAEKNK